MGKQTAQAKEVYCAECFIVQICDLIVVFVLFYLIGFCKLN